MYLKMQCGWRMEESLRSPYFWLHDMWKVPKGPPSAFFAPPDIFVVLMMRLEVGWPTRSTVLIPPECFLNAFAYSSKLGPSSSSSSSLEQKSCPLFTLSTFTGTIIYEETICLPTGCFNMVLEFGQCIWLSSCLLETWVHFHFMQGLLSSFISFSVVKIFMNTLLRAVHTSKAI